MTIFTRYFVLLATLLLMFVIRINSNHFVLANDVDQYFNRIDPDSTEDQYDYRSQYTYNVNIIYFTPTDVEPLPDYRSRLSGFLLYIQDYYSHWMNYWGYGKKTFGLLKDDGRVKITHIKAKHPVSEYPNNGGGYKARDEIKAYFDENIDAAPDSKHYLVFMPKPETEPEGGLPYYGLGKWGFVIDVGQSAEKAPNSGGGAAHELGHALGLPHNAHPKSRKLEIGTALMNNGNNVWNHRGGSKTTSLTEATTEILNNNQVFSKEKSDFYSSIDATLTDTSGTYKNGDIIVDGKFQSNVPVTKAVVILNPEGRASYNQIGFVSTIERNRFQVEISKKELFEADNANYGLKVWLVFENGQRKKYDLPSFSFKDGKPDISFP